MQVCMCEHVHIDIYVHGSCISVCMWICAFCVGGGIDVMGECVCRSTM